MNASSCINLPSPGAMLPAQPDRPQSKPGPGAPGNLYRGYSHRGDACMIRQSPREPVAMRACRVMMSRYDGLLQQAEAMWQKERITNGREGKA